MIPFQALGGDRGPGLFLAWIPAAAIPAASHAPMKGTVPQVVATFYHLAATYRLHLPFDTLAAFQAACRVKPNFMMRVPHGYFRCNDHTQYLAFDWFTYADLMLGGAS